jgi:hypothetical protein
MRFYPPKKDSFNLATGLPAKRLVWLKGAGHIPNISCPLKGRLCVRGYVILVLDDIVLSDIHYFHILPKYCYRIQETKTPANSF